MMLEINAVAEADARAHSAAEALMRHAGGIAKGADRKGVENLLKTVQHHARTIGFFGREPAHRVASARMCLLVVDAMLDDPAGWNVREATMPHLRDLRETAVWTLEAHDNAA